MALAVDRYGSDKVLGIHQHTGFDHPLTYEHMDYMRGRYGVEIQDIKNQTYATVPEVMIGEKIIPSRLARVCTDRLKTTTFFKWLQSRPMAEVDDMLILLGMRAAESNNRRERYKDNTDEDLYTMLEVNQNCPKDVGHVKVMLPIVEWTTPTVFEFLRKRGDKINPLYAKGFSRVGCFPCVLAGKQTMRLVARDPHGRENLRSLQQAIEIVRAGNPRALFDQDIPSLLANKEADPFGIFEMEEEEQAGGCSWCNL